MHRLAAVLAALLAGTLIGWGIVEAGDAWSRKPPDSDAWLTVVGAAAAALLAVIGTYVFTRRTEREAAQLALDNALIVWRKQRDAETADHETRILRNALVALLDECRNWQKNDPNKGVDVAARLLDSQLARGQVRLVLDTISIPPQLLRYLLWIQSHAALVADGFRDSVAQTQKSIGGAHLDIDKWRDVIERLQVMACLLIAEARRRGLAPIAQAFADDPLLRPQVYPPHYRTDVQREAEARHGAPSWPGDPAYSECSPEARDGTPVPEYAYDDAGIAPEE